MPLTEKGSEILHAMEKEYGTDKGKQVFYASKNKGTISGVDSAARIDAIARAAHHLCQRFDAFNESDHPRDNEGKFTSGSSFDVDRHVEARRIEPVNKVNSKKVEKLAKSMAKDGWVGRPVLTYEGANGTTALTGSHRIAAAKKSDIEVPIMDVDDDVLYFTDEDGNTLTDYIGTGDDNALVKFLREAGDNRSADLVQAEIDANEQDYDENSRSDSLKIGGCSVARLDAIMDGCKRLYKRLDAMVQERADYGSRRADPERDELERRVKEAGSKLKVFPKGKMGLTPDDVKASPEWKSAKSEYNRAFEALRSYNGKRHDGGDAPGEGDLPYGKAEEAGYADPGYRGGEKRYPLKKDGEWSEERIRAAWNYIHKERDADKYTAPQLKRIKEKIVSAWKKAIDEKGPPEAHA